MTTTHNMKVIVVQKNKGVAVEHKPIPQPKANEVLLRILAVGQNPTDYKHVDYELAKPGDYLGCDYVGEVVDMGPEVPKDQVKKGEIRWNFCRGGRGPKGAFAEYITSEWDLTSLVPPNITPEQAAGLPIPLMTAVQALYLPARLNLPEPPVSKPSNEWILIWSGATSVGIYAIQLAKLSGLKVATTASPKRWDQLKGYGADVCVDYKDPDVVDKLKKATNDGIKHGVDCVTNGESYRKSQLAFGPQGGHLITTLFEIEDLPRSDVKVTPTLVYTGLGEDHYWGDFYFPTDKTHRDLHAHWAKKLTKLLGEGKLKPAEINVLGGLEDIPKGLDLMREGKHDGKLVYSVAKAAASGSV